MTLLITTGRELVGGALSNELEAKIFELKVKNARKENSKIFIGKEYFLKVVFFFELCFSNE